MVGAGAAGIAVIGQLLDSKVNPEKLPGLIPNLKLEILVRRGNGL